MSLTTEMRLPSATKEEGHHFTYVGRFRYAITMPVRRGVRVFVTEEAVKGVHDRLIAVARQTEFEVIAYCYLPEKLSIIVGGKEDTSDLRAFLKTLRATTAELTPGAPLWSRHYLERVVRKGEDMKRVAHELYRLPVVAGLAKQPSEYPYQGSLTGLTPEVTSPREGARGKTEKKFRGAPRPRDAEKRGSRPRGH